ncbi:MMPL family transporter [bacterium]|nr:MMPL family transporter [bacterium]
MRVISRFSTRFPKTIIFLILSITAFFIYQFQTKAYVESDTTKFLPTDMVTVKANDYYQKNFSYNESLIIGIESEEKGIMDPSVLRTIEKIVMEIRELRVRKTIDSQLTGRKEIIELPIGIDIEDITSISGLEDAIMDRETGAVVSGSVIKKLKKEAGIPFTEQTAERLPESDADLVRIIPALKQHILNDRLFRGNLLSENQKATAIHIPMINKWEYKQRYAQLELMTAIDPILLKKRFQGNTSSFPFKVYGKSLKGVHYDEAYIAEHSKKVQRALKEHLEEYLSPAYKAYPVLEELVKGELTSAGFEQILKITQDKDFFMNPEMTTWDMFINKLYDFMLDHIDPLSHENLQFQLPNVEHVYDLLDIYDKSSEILAKNSGDEINFYIAGNPVVISVMSRIISRDMGLLLPIGVLVILLMLTLSFRSIKGVLIPMMTVVLSVIWALGFMALTGTPITTSTSIIPIILLAVGSAYGIHFLNRYNEDAKTSTDRKKVLRLTIEGVGVAIIMAGLTTFSGFLSLSSSSILMIRHFALYTSFGVCVALLLTLTLSPAILTFWKLPKQSPSNDNKETQKGGRFERILYSWAVMVKMYPKAIVLVFGAITVVSGILMKDLTFEGGMIADFKKDNPLRKSDGFINKYLTGTGQINLLFKFRDTVNLENEWITTQLKSRGAEFGSAWDNMLDGNRLIEQSAVDDLRTEIERMTEDPVPNKKKLIQSIALLNDILNEEYTVESQVKNSVRFETEESDLNALLEEEFPAEEELDDLSDLGELAEVSAKVTNDGQTNGLKRLNQRLNLAENRWEETGRAIVMLRDKKTTREGQHMVHQWNLLQDLFAADIKQPQVLHKLENLRDQLIAMKAPKVEIDGDLVNPTGFVSGPVDMIRKTYSVFYFDENPAYKKIPDTRSDNLADPTLTDRGVIGVVLNQAQNSNRDAFEGMVSADLKEFQVSIMVRDSLTTFASAYLAGLQDVLDREFPGDDPYIESISIGGQVPVNLEIMTMIAKSQVTSVAQAMFFVFIITFFIFRSAVGGLYSLIPLVFTIVANFGMMILLGWKINTGTVMVASISIGIGVDYTIHFLERFKAQLIVGDKFDQAYFNTIQSVGKAILINAVSVAAGFMVLLASDMGGTRSMGLLMFGTMAYSSLAALTLLPAVIFVTKPKFLTKTVIKHEQWKLAAKN